MAITTWNTTSLTGGTTRSLDVLTTASLTDGDRSFCHEGAELFVHYFDAAGTEAENDPAVIRPDDFVASGSVGVWKIVKSPLDVPALQSIGNAGTTQDLDCANYDTFLITCDQTTLTLTISSLSVGSTAAIVITDGDNVTAGITWPTEVAWAGAVAPDFSTGVDRVVMQRITSTIIHAALAGAEYA